LNCCNICSKSSNETSAYLSKKYEIIGNANGNGYMTYGCSKAYYACTNMLKSRGKLNTDQEKCSNNNYIDVDKLENEVRNLVLKLGNYKNFKDVYKEKRISLDNITELENILDFTLMNNAEEMKNKVRLIFKYFIYNPVTKQIKMEFL